MTGPWHLWSKQPPPPEVLCQFENQATGKKWTGRPEDVREGWHTGLGLWRLTGIAKEARHDEE